MSVEVVVNDPQSPLLIASGVSWVVDSQNRLIVYNAGNPQAQPPVAPEQVGIFTQWMYAITT